MRVVLTLSHEDRGVFELENDDPDPQRGPRAVIVGSDIAGEVSDFGDWPDADVLEGPREGVAAAYAAMSQGATSRDFSEDVASEGGFGPGALPHDH